MDAGNDILIRLYGQGDHGEAFRALEAKGIVVKRMMAVDTSQTLEFVTRNFSAIWADEARFAMMHRNCFIAVEGTKLVGFACIQATAPEFFGPIGVLPEARGKGVATALLHRAMLAMKDKGYKYAVAGAVRGPMARIIKRNYSAIEIPESIGSYEDLIDPGIVD
ncbi:MAG: GNAT family N-acetyltransferase [Kiritimatiellae bacterium]|nr:GNAT family N-acetyltransferase [Kiritimatiellia bacterium]